MQFESGWNGQGLIPAIRDADSEPDAIPVNQICGDAVTAHALRSVAHAALQLATALSCLSASPGVAAQPAQGATAIVRTPTGPVAAPHRVEVFANSAMLLTHADGATVYLLDGLQLLEAQLSQGLPATEAEAARVARERVQRLGGQLQQRAANAAQGMALAAQYGIDRIPAVVIDGRAIVYGMTDVQKAVAAYALRQEPAR